MLEQQAQRKDVILGDNKHGWRLNRGGSRGKHTRRVAGRSAKVWSREELGRALGPQPSSYLYAAGVRGGTRVLILTSTGSKQNRGLLSPLLSNSSQSVGELTALISCR